MDDENVGQTSSNSAINSVCLGRADAGRSTKSVSSFSAWAASSLSISRSVSVDLAATS